MRRENNITDKREKGKDSPTESTNRQKQAPSSRERTGQETLAWKRERQRAKGKETKENPSTVKLRKEKEKRKSRMGRGSGRSWRETEIKRQKLSEGRRVAAGG